MSLTNPLNVLPAWMQRTSGAALLALLSAATAGFVFDSGTRNAVVQQTTGVLEMLEGRSPGERKVGELTKMKRQRSLPSHTARPQHPLLSDAQLPEERALGKVFGPQNPSPRLGDDEIPLTSPLLTYDTPLVGLGSASTASVPMPEIMSGPYLAPPASGPLFIPVGTTSAAPPVINPVTPIAEVPSVPEPSTWIVLVTGFGFCAAAMRRRRRSAQPKRLQCA